MTPGAIRVLVVEDSLTVRRRLCEILADDPQFEVVGEAADGARAIELCRDLRPSVVTMDMMLPEISGLAATEHIMAHCPTPILVVSSSFNRGEMFKTYEALSAGAVDVLEKPTGNEPEGAWERRFIATVRIVSRIRVITHPLARLKGLCVHPTPEIRAAVAPAAKPASVIAIGASTGGPGAIVEVLRALPPDFAVPVLFVLHISPVFSRSFAQWLGEKIARRVELAEDGHSVAAAGHVIMAPPDQHLIVKGGRLRLTDEPERHSCRPSVDVLFESVAREYGPSAAGCLLTGMGRDGAAGLLAIRAAGGVTIAQDEATSVVYGMPREAALIGAAQRILPIGDIGPRIAALAGSVADATAP